MKINPTDVKVPLQKTVEVKNGTIEVSLSKRNAEASLACQEFVSIYAAIAETSTVEEAIAEFVKHESAILETSESAELTPAQKKLPPNIQKAILEKMKKKGGAEKSETKKEEKSEDMKKQESKAEMEEMDEEEECEDGEDGKPCGKESCAVCKSNASSQKTKNLTKDDYIAKK